LIESERGGAIGSHVPDISTLSLARPYPSEQQSGNHSHGDQQGRDIAQLFTLPPRQFDGGKSDNGTN
jgi:hypothetical protein